MTGEVGFYVRFSWTKLASTLKVSGVLAKIVCCLTWLSMQPLKAARGCKKIGLGNVCELFPPLLMLSSDKSSEPQFLVADWAVRTSEESTLKRFPADRVLVAWSMDT